MDRFQNKTRIVIAGNNQKTEAAKLFLHVIHFFGNQIDNMTSFSEHVAGNDFVLFESENDQLSKYHPNIALITGSTDNNTTQDFLKTIVGGGIVIYNEEDENLKNWVEESENYFRKIPYTKPNFTENNSALVISTNIGDIPLQFSEENLTIVEGVKHLSQQLRIMEEDFYEAILEF